MEERSIVGRVRKESQVMAPSKTFNLPGLQASFAVIQNAELRERFDKERKDLVPWINVMGLVAMQAAYQGG